MTLTLELTPTEEARLAAAAEQEGLPPTEWARKVLSDHLPPLPVSREEDPMLALFAQWEHEDAAMTPEEVAAEQRLWEEFKMNIDAERQRAGARRLF